MSDIELVEAEEITYNGKPAKRYPDGTIRHVRGYILFLPPEVAAQRRYQGVEKSRIAAEEALARATNTETAEEGWSKIIEAKTKIALEDKGRAGNDAARLVGIAAGFYNKTQVVQVDKKVTHGLAPFPREYTDYLKKKNGSVIDAEFEDSDDE